MFPFANHELSGVDQFLFGQLAGNAALLALLAVQPPPTPNGTPPLGIYAELAPEGALAPFVIFALIASIDRNVIGSDARSFTRPLYLCKAVTQGSSLIPGEQIAKQIDVALLGARGNVAGENIGIMGTHRTEMIRYVEVDQGVRWVHTGGRYQLMCQALS